MNEAQLVACRKIFEAVTRRPISKIFYDVSSEVANKEISVPMTFKIISDKLDKGSYTSPSQFVSDMRMIFLNGDSYDPKISIRPAAVSLLINDFEEALAKYAPSALTINIKLRVIVDQIEKIINHDTIIPEQITTYKEKPASHFFEVDNESAPVTFDLIKEEISLLKSSDLIIKTIAYIHSLQPEAVEIKSGVSIHYSLLNEESKKNVHQYVLQLLYDSALGRIDGFSNSMLENVEPVIIEKVQFQEEKDSSSRSRSRKKGPNPD